MWIKDKITYTPEVIEIKNGESVIATVKSVSVDGNYFTLLMPNGSEERIERRLCAKG